jgi:endonuclease YncB( thermonuclease family)
MRRREFIAGLGSAAAWPVVARGQRIVRAYCRIAEGPWVVHLALIATFVVASMCANAAELSGPARIHDADTLTIGDARVRLEGIDAPETDQRCLTAAGELWMCGIAARDQVRAYVGDRVVTCTSAGRDRYKRTLAVCMVEDVNLNSWLVRQGWALAFRRYSQAYIGEEDGAQAEQRGLWSGAFIAPWDWRHRNKNTQILGALAVPVEAQAELLSPASATKAPPGCEIKGNVGRHGLRIYHLPGQISYEKINMEKLGARWFCTEEEAQAADWRKALR